MRYEAPYSANNLLSVYPILKDHKDVKRSMLSFDSVDRTPVDGHSLLLWQIHQRNSFAYRAVMGRYVNQKYDKIIYITNINNNSIITNYNKSGSYPLRVRS